MAEAIKGLVTYGGTVSLPAEGIDFDRGYSFRAERNGQLLEWQAVRPVRVGEWAVFTLPELSAEVRHIVEEPPRDLRDTSGAPVDEDIGVSESGGLRSIVPWIDWDEGSELVVLDGTFTARMLRRIADVMEGKS